MVSTRQMTGATSEESSLHLCRTVPTASTSNVSPNVVTITSTVNTKAAFSQHILQPSSLTSYGAVPSCSSNSLSNVDSCVLSNDQQVQQRQDINIMDLPTEILGHIFSFVGYKKIAHMRVISRQMNKVCCSILNSTFQKLQNQMHARFQTVKAKMPRRESARRNHPLACECDILETCYMRLSLLQMTFGKHIERKHCCFFPGGILDEVYSVLNYIRTSTSLDRPFKVTDELFDLSTMAMEYFKEHIEPNLPDIAYFTNSTKSFAALETSSSILSRDTSHSNTSSPPQSNMVLRKGIRKIKQGMKRYNNQLTVLRSELRTCKRKATEQAKTITEQQKLLAEQQKQTLEFANRLDETDKKNDELSRKFSTVLQELNKCKTELQYWRSKSPATTNPYGQVVPSYELQTLGSQSMVPYDIDLLSIGIGRNVATGNAEDNRKKDDPGQNKDKLEHNSQTPRAKGGESLVLSESAEPLPTTMLTKPGLKRKLDSITAAENYITDCTNAKDPARLDGLVCLNPPFASASIVASYSSSTSSSAMHASAALPGSENGSMLISSVPLPLVDNKSASNSTENAGFGLVYSSTDASGEMNEIQNFTSTTHDDSSYETSLPFASVKPIFNNTKAIHQPNTNHTLNQNSDNSNNSSSFSSNVDSKNDSPSNDNNTNIHIKKIRRVQNKARSQSYNRHSNLNATTTTHTKTTRSKQLDKLIGN
ncbi:probable serine/threonine-protein kinase ndrD [Anopheles moucheti]|uniref:probable serine/threonine-protein kinase ndrD n=1 Tax=Anopheles moucheti TaxID=186751 RepID=UPI0022F0CB5E|nr:probable serine/threonine-protein kinase ndrD [Anopheles moucheti]